MSSRTPARRLAMVLCCASALVVGPAVARADGAWRADRGRQIVSVGHDSLLGPGERAADLVAVFGSSIDAGEVSDSVVAVFGDARVTGTVGNNTVAVFGNAHVNGKVSGNVVSVFGSVTLGPQAVVGGRVVNVLGSVSRDANATIEGSVERVFSLPFAGLSGWPAWVRRCLFYGRLLALEPQVAWAWGLALAALGFYLLLAALFGDAVTRCVRTLETHPGRSILAALVAVLFSPVIYLALLVTVVGIALIPIVWTGFLCASLFGKGVALAWLGERCLRGNRAGRPAHVVLDVLVGGLIMLALYLIPVVGFAAFTVFGLLGFGAVLYTLIVAASAGRSSAAHASPTFSAAESDAPRAGRTPGSTPQNGEIPVDESTLPRAGFWIRIGALLIDAVLVGIILAVLHDAFGLELILLAGYGAVMWKLKGTTIGGIVCDLKVTRVDGRPIDWGTAVIRALGCFLSLAVAGLGFVWIALDPQRQAWHDKIAGTVVVRVPRGVSLV
jgi:uncharacterized RDD family membrane protein YckC